MTLALVLGGARSGKTRIAELLAGTGQDPVAFIATAEAGDEEMRERIERHRQARPMHWVSIEEPIDLLSAVESVEPGSRVIVDCLTLWVSNLVGHGIEDEDIERRAGVVATRLAEREPVTVAVSNEVGSGIVPVNSLARRYRDLLGRVNTIWADAADQVYLAVAGGVVPVLRLDEMWSRHG